MSEKHELVDKIVSGALWIYLATYASKVLVFITTIILANLITKSDFGVIGYTFIITSVLDSIYDLGIGAAYIYHKDEDGLADTAFWLTVLYSLLVALIVWITAPLVAAYFNDNRAIDVIHIYSVFFPVTALGNTHEFILRKRLAFKQNMVPTIASSLVKGIISIVLALLGFGYWSIIFGQVVGAVVSTIAYWVVVPWRPVFTINRSLVPSLLLYGIKTSFLNLMIALLLNIDYLFTGHYLGAEELGVYTLAFRIPDMIITQFGVVINRVTFPAFVNIRDQEQSLAHGFIITLKFICAAILPTGAGIILVSEPFWRTFFPDTWLEAVPVMSIITVYTIMVTLVIGSESVYKTMGKLRTMIKLYLIRLIMIAPALYFATTVIRSIEAVAWAQAGAAFILCVINMVVTTKLIKISIHEIMKIMQPSVISTLVMSIVVWGLLQICGSIAPLAQIIVSILVGLGVYGVMLNWQDHSIVQESFATFRRIFSLS